MRVGNAPHIGVRELPIPRMAGGGHIAAPIIACYDARSYDLCISLGTCLAQGWYRPGTGLVRE